MTAEKPKNGERRSESLTFSREQLAEVGFSADGGADGLARFSANVYTGTRTVSRFYGKLVIDLEQMTFPRQKSPVLWMHYGGRLGYTETVAVRDGEVFAEGVLLTKGDGDHHELARQIVHDDALGYPWELSIGVDFDLEEVSEGETVTVNGTEFAGPLYVGRRAVFRELSIVDIGADDSTGVEFFSRLAGSAAGGSRFAEALAAAVRDQQNTQGEGAESKLMDIKDATAADIEKENPEAAAEIKKAGAEEAMAEAEGDGKDGNDESMMDGDEKEKEQEGAAKGGSGADMSAGGADIETLEAIEGATPELVLEAFKLGFNETQARAVFARSGAAAKPSVDPAVVDAALGNGGVPAEGREGGGALSFVSQLSGKDPESDYAKSESLRSFCTGYFGNGNEDRGKAGFLSWAKAELAEESGSYDLSGLVALHESRR